MSTEEEKNLRKCGNTECPKCGKKIDHLNNIARETVRYHFYGDYYELVDSEPVGDSYFVCPECMSLLAMSEEEAKEILE